MTECLIRLDDITPDMDWDKFNQVKDILERYRICPLIGVVPDNRDRTLHKDAPKETFWNTLLELQQKGWKIAQHGTYHVYETNHCGILGINPFSEFAGLSYEEQLRKLKCGREILRKNGILTDIFMAPGHTYDANTIKALKECGFTTITDGLYKMPYTEDGILCIPCRMQGLRIVKGVDTVCLHTNLMQEKDMKELDKFCRDNQKVILSFDPLRYQEGAPKKNAYIKIAERILLKKRIIKDRIANSKRLAWYLSRTNHQNSKKKWVRRILFLPLLLGYREENGKV